METFNIFDEEHEIKQSFKKAVCVYETHASEIFGEYDSRQMSMGEVVYNVKIIVTGSILFTLSEDSEDYFVTMFPQMFGIPTPGQVERIEEIEQQIQVLFDENNKIWTRIEKTGHTEIPESNQ